MFLARYLAPPHTHTYTVNCELTATRGPHRLLIQDTRTVCHSQPGKVQAAKSHLTLRTDWVTLLLQLSPSQGHTSALLLCWMAPPYLTISPRLEHTLGELTIAVSMPLTLCDSLLSPVTALFFFQAQGCM